MELIFVTGNANKFIAAEAICKKHGIKLSQLILDIDEIQSEDSELIVSDKAKRAYDLVGKPIIVSDDTWHFSALNGFPGAYIKSMNHWFETEDFLDLMQRKKDRGAIIIQLLAYYDGNNLVIFRKDASGQILKERKGNSEIPIRNIYAPDHDGGRTLAELDAVGETNSDERLKRQPEPWTELIQWLKANRTNL